MLTDSLAFDLAVALVPALAWLAWFLRKDRYEPEPRGLVLRAFVYGMAIVPAALVLERQLDALLAPFARASALPRWAHLALLVAPLEELLKFAVVRLRFYPDPEFNEPVDGIVYATTVAIGFATLENALYMRWAGAGTLVYRSLAATMLHLGCSGLVGYALGRRKFSTHRPIVGRAVAGAVLLHAGFDVMVAYGAEGAGPLRAGLVLGALATFLWWLYATLDLSIDESLERSPFRPRPGRRKPGQA